MVSFQGGKILVLYVLSFATDEFYSPFLVFFSYKHVISIIKFNIMLICEKQAGEK